MKRFKRYTFKLFNIGKPVAIAIMKAHKKRGISRSAWLLEAVLYKLVREGIKVNTEKYGDVFVGPVFKGRYSDLVSKSDAERAVLMYQNEGFVHGIFAAQTGPVKMEVMSNSDIVKSTFEDGSSCFVDYKNHVIKLNKKAELKEVSN